MVDLSAEAGDTAPLSDVEGRAHPGKVEDTRLLTLAGEAEPSGPSGETDPS